MDILLITTKHGNVINIKGPLTSADFLFSKPHLLLLLLLDYRQILARDGIRRQVTIEVHLELVVPISTQLIHQSCIYTISFILKSTDGFELEYAVDFAGETLANIMESGLRNDCFLFYYFKQ